MLFRHRVSRQEFGTRLLPHRFKDDRYHVRLGKQGPYIPITDHRDIPSYLANGYSLEMSNKDEKHNPSLIAPNPSRAGAKTSSHPGTPFARMAFHLGALP